MYSRAVYAPSDWPQYPANSGIPKALASLVPLSYTVFSCSTTILIGGIVPAQTGKGGVLSNEDLEYDQVLRDQSHEVIDGADDG